MTTYRKVNGRKVLVRYGVGRDGRTKLTAFQIANAGHAKRLTLNDDPRRVKA